MWNQNELEHAKQELAQRRERMLDKHVTELKQMLASHTEELKKVDADYNEIEALEKTLNSVLRKFKAPPAENVVAI